MSCHFSPKYSLGRIPVVSATASTGPFGIGRAVLIMSALALCSPHASRRELATCKKRSIRRLADPKADDHGSGWNFGEGQPGGIICARQPSGAVCDFYAFAQWADPRFDAYRPPGARHRRDPIVLLAIPLAGIWRAFVRSHR
jgi:hypothetical protein